MLRYISLSFYTNDATTSLAEAIKRYSPAYGYAPFLAKHYEVEIIMHFSKKEAITKDNVRYTGLAGKRDTWSMPFNTFRYIKSRKPDVIVVEGFTSPVILLLFRLLIGYRCPIIVQHHGERPYKKGPKRLVQKIACRFINACLFTSIQNAKEWYDSKTIKKRIPCFEVMEATAALQQKDKMQSKKQLSMQGDYNFLWVGRLDNNKDPLTALTAFEKYLPEYPEARMYIIYQSEEILGEIIHKIEQSPILHTAIILVGKIEHAKLAFWYSAADFYISCSHRESTGYALLEAMACGCIPIVTRIPSFEKITAAGEFGLLFEAGNAESLLQRLHETTGMDRQTLSARILNHYQTDLSAKSQAEQIYKVCETLVSVNA